MGWFLGFGASTLRRIIDIFWNLERETWKNVDYTSIALSTSNPLTKE